MQAPRPLSRVLVTGISKNIHQDLLEVYFDSGKSGNVHGVDTVIEYDAHRGVAMVDFGDEAGEQCVLVYKHL